ncbi:MAG: twin-arginine translocase TatA/TatE family subunit [Elusimicrobiota bacterium]
MPNIGIGELVVILVIVLLVFGAKKLPEIGRAIGQAVKSFKDGMKNSSDGDDESKNGKI